MAVAAAAAMAPALALTVSGVGHAYAADLAAAMGRAALQLCALGALLLPPLLMADGPGLLLCWLLLVVCIAAREVCRKAGPHSYRGQLRHAAAAVGGGGGLALGVAVWLVIRPEPRWSARVVVPVAGMLFGAALSAVSLAQREFLSEVAERPGRLTLALALGASNLEALGPSVRTAMQVALTPNMNQMSVAGLVSIPGMVRLAAAAARDAAEVLTPQPRR